MKAVVPVDGKLIVKEVPLPRPRADEGGRSQVSSFNQIKTENENDYQKLKLRVK
jgi:hypothetical protein